MGPIAVAMDGSQEAFFNYFDGVYNDPNCTQSLTHAVLLIGYGTDPVLGDYWLCKNSWVILFQFQKYQFLKFTFLRVLGGGIMDFLKLRGMIIKVDYLRAKQNVTYGFRNANNHCGFGLYAVYPVLDLV